MLRTWLSATVVLGLLFASTATRAGDVAADPKVAASVNGEAIYESQLTEDIPKKFFGNTIKYLKTLVDFAARLSAPT